MDKKYEDFFEKIKQFKKEQDKQKQRGLNNYNILTTVLKVDDEVRLHSRMIYSFLNPNGTHYQSTLFLDKFLEILKIGNDFNIDSNNCRVYKEYQDIDLYITDGSKHIIIENKVKAYDQENQIKRYIEIVQEENTNLEMNDILVIYLSLDRKEPTPYSLGDLKINGAFIEKNLEQVTQFKSIHYKNEIVDWLEACQYEIQNITNLNEVFKQYIDVVRMLNNKYEEKVMSLSGYIKDDIDVYKMALEIQKELPKMRKEVIDSFFEEAKNLLQEKLGTEWIIERNGELLKKWNVSFKIYKASWDIDKSNKLIFGFEFNNNDYYNGAFGVVRQKNTAKINDIKSNFTSKIEKLNLELNSSTWWLDWECLPNIKGVDDFITYILFNEDAMETVIKEILDFIEKFEINSDLLTEINSYLDNKSTL